MVNKKPYIAITSVGIAVNFILFLTKLYIGISTNSISIYVDSLNNLADSFVCIVAMIGFCFLAVKVSRSYPFGLGRAEDIASFITSLVIIFTGFAFAYVSIQRIMYPSPVWFSVKYAVVISVTAVVKLLLALFYKQSSKKHFSLVLQGLYLDSILDFFITLTTIISFTLTSYVGYSVDGIFGLFISIILCVSGGRACFKSCTYLVGKSDADFEKSIEKAILDVENVSDVVTLQCHRYGRKYILSCEILAHCMSVQDVMMVESNVRQNVNKVCGFQIIVSVINGEG